jgi:hypothetical protein
MATDLYADKIELQELLFKYAYSIDVGTSEEYFVDLFTEDALLLSPHSGRHEGVEQLKEFYRNSDVKRPQVQIRHCISNVIVDLDGDDAKIRAHFIETSTNNRPAFEGDPQKAEILFTGGYDIRAVKRDGKWLIQRRLVHIDHRHLGDGKPNDDAVFFS